MKYPKRSCWQWQHQVSNRGGNPPGHSECKRSRCVSQSRSGPDGDRIETAEPPGTLSHCSFVLGSLLLPVCPVQSSSPPATILHDAMMKWFHSNRKTEQDNVKMWTYSGFELICREISVFLQQQDNVLVHSSLNWGWRIDIILKRASVPTYEIEISTRSFFWHKIVQNKIQLISFMLSCRNVSY